MQDSKLRPTKIIDLKRNDVEIVRSYMQIKSNSKDFIKKFPEWEYLPKSLEIEIVTALRERDAAKSRLETKRKEKKTFDRIMDKKWKDLEQKQKDLTKAEEMHDMFSSDCRSKCEMLAGKIKEENEEKKRLEMQMIPMQESITQLEETADKMQHSVDELKPFENFLEKVVSESNEYKSIDDLIKRYENLTNMRNELILKYETKSSELSRLKTDLFKHSKEKNEEAENISVEIAEVTELWVKTREEMIKTDLAFRKLENVAKEKKIEYPLVAASVWNIYKQMCKRVKHPVPHKRVNVETQLDFVADKYQELTKVLHMAEKIKERTNKKLIHKS
ncbi:coiled-coil domain-containing protein 42 homolog [Adelges cooleyi]|uniref:coiled-coil domain-containing protein 42 homolog n=1 Tax=Adelges cooleyi TaxID=133065 RepID=UPI002180297F|nr:coiled-coil domain-containing protein 42 homolog [Adelges cooleyi]